jgi:alpha-N-arabinofuranosidase
MKLFHRHLFVYHILVPGLVFLVSIATSGRVALAGPSDVQVTVETKSKLQTVRQEEFGLNTVTWFSDLATTKVIDLVKQTDISSFRFPGGSTSDEYNWTKPQWPGQPNIKDFGILIDSMKGDGIITLNYGTGTPQMAASWVAYCDSSPGNTADIGVDSAGFDWKTAGYWASLRASEPLLVDDGLNSLRANHPLPYPITRFEVGNECYGDWETDHHPKKQDPVLYAQYYAQTYHLIKLVAPNAAVGAVITGDEKGRKGHPGPDDAVINPVTHELHTSWSPEVLSTLYGLGVIPDFVIYHCYPEWPTSEDDAKLLQASTKWADVSTSIRSMLTDYLHGQASKTYLFATENNSVDSKPGKQTTSLVNALYYADSFGSIVSTEFRGLYWWDLYNSISTDNNNSDKLYGWRNYGDYGILSSGPDQPYTPYLTPYPVYRAMELIKKFCQAGDTVVSTTSSSTNVAVYAVQQPGHKLAILLINKSPSDTWNADLSISGYRPSPDASLWSFGIPQDLAQSQGQLSDIIETSIANADQKFILPLAPYSISVLILQAKHWRLF